MDRLGSDYKNVLFLTLCKEFDINIILCCQLQEDISIAHIDLNTTVIVNLWTHLLYHVSGCFDWDLKLTSAEAQKETLPMTVQDVKTISATMATRTISTTDSVCYQ